MSTSDAISIVLLRYYIRVNSLGRWLVVVRKSLRVNVSEFHEHTRSQCFLIVQIPPINFNVLCAPLLPIIMYSIMLFGEASYCCL